MVEVMKIVKIRFADNRIYGLTDEGKELWQSMLYYRRLLNATEKQRMNYEINSFGIHWPDIDEDISFESFEYDNPEPKGIAKIFLSYPELNISAVARRIGINQSLLAAYINGDKKPSEKRERFILDKIGQLGADLINISQSSLSE